MNVPEITTAAEGYLVKTLDHDFNHPRDERGRLQVFLTERRGQPIPRPGETVIVEDRDDEPPLRARGRVAYLIAVIEDEEWLREGETAE